MRREVRFDKISKSLLIVSPFYPMRDGPGNLDAVHSMLHCYDHSPLLTNLNTKYFLDSKQEDRKAHWINAGRVLAADHQQTYEALTAEILDDLEKNLFTRDLPRFAFHSHPTGNLFLARLLERMSEQMDDPQYILDMTGPASEVVLAAARRKPPMEIITPWALAPLFGAAPVQVSPHQPNESAGRMASASRGGRRDRLLLAGLQEAGSDALLGLISQLSGLSVDPWQAIVSLDDLQGVAPESLAAAGCDSVLIHLNSVSDSFFDKLGAPYRVAGLMDLLDGLRSGGVAVDVSLEIGHPYETDEHYYDTLRFFRDGRELIRRISALATYLIRPGSRFDPSAEQEGLCYPRILPLHNWHDRWVSNFMYRGKRLRETIIYLLGQGYDFPSRYIPGNGPFLRHRKRIEARLEREVAGDRVMVSVGPR